MIWLEVKRLAEMAKEEGDDDQYLLPKQARPPPKMQAYYTSWKNRGYLCPQVQMREFLRARPEFKDSFAKALGTIEEEKATEEPMITVTSLTVVVGRQLTR